MTVKSRKRFGLDVVVRPARFLLEGGQLDAIQRVLRENAPRWCGQARMWRSRSDQQAIDLARTGALEDIIRKLEARRRSSAMVKALEAKFGAPRFPRFHQGLEIRDTADALTVVITVDEYVLAPLAAEWIFGNRVTLQVRRSKVEGVDAVTWAAEVFEALCGALSPLHGDVHSWDEYDAKNMSHEGGGLQAVGVDVSKYLPGLYWLNFLGKPYCDLMGRDRLLSAPATEVRKVDDGVLLRLVDNPRKWASPEYKAIERRVLDHIGPQYFFSKDQPNRKTTAPDFGLPRT